LFFVASLFHFCFLLCFFFVSFSAGTLSIMVGGDPVPFEQTKGVFECMGSHVVRMGEGGTGTAAKLVNQLLVGCHATAASEVSSDC
jgi:3-hydroxyisobutyrate dehydrogenase-like beta-hydroxyacid dehydrogenase